MKITGTQIGAIAAAQVRKVGKTGKTDASEATRSTDQVVLSSDMSAIEAAKKAIERSPEVRAEKVEELRKQIADGTYHVPAEQIADRILAEARLAKLGNK